MQVARCATAAASGCAAHTLLLHSEVASVITVQFHFSIFVTLCAAWRCYRCLIFWQKKSTEIRLNWFWDLPQLLKPNTRPALCLYCLSECSYLSVMCFCLPIPMTLLHELQCDPSFLNKLNPLPSLGENGRQSLEVLVSAHIFRFFYTALSILISWFVSWYTFTAPICSLRNLSSGDINTSSAFWIDLRTKQNTQCVISTNQQ